LHFIKCKLNTEQMLQYIEQYDQSNDDVVGVNRQELVQNFHDFPFLKVYFSSANFLMDKVLDLAR